MEKIKTNLFKMSDFSKPVCAKWEKIWLENQNEKEEIDLNFWFKHYEVDYHYIYEYNETKDLIGWQVDNNCFNWDKYFHNLLQYCPEHFDSEKYNWGENSDYVARYCPEHFDKNKYNWENFSWAIAQYCPEFFDSEKYNWEKSSWAIARYCPEKLKTKIEHFENYLKNKKGSNE